ncbi:MAG: type II toxin-antitoxin system PemK/MazF family toxin [Chloroflexota bacterium]
MAARGDIVLARFPFTDGSGAKLRPVLILAPVPGPYDDFIVMFISSQASYAVPGVDVILDRSNPAFAGSGLKMASAFRVGKVASLSAGLIVGPLGALHSSVFDDLVTRLVRLLQSR